MLSQRKEFAYNDKSHKVNYAIGQQWSIEFLNHFNMDFGIKYDSIQGSHDKKTFHEGEFRVSSNINTIKSLYVYSDIVQHQYTGDSFAPLIKVVDNERSF